MYPRELRFILNSRGYMEKIYRYPKGDFCLQEGLALGSFIRYNHGI